MPDDGDTRPPRPTDRETESVSSTSVESRSIGPYRLLEKIGEGGMGEVWLAEQTAPVKRRVALKVIKQGMDSRQVVARFEAERQALALMDHPSVAKVFDAGVTPDGRPFFAMEHVKGVPITQHCDRQRLSNRDRLTLFTAVCEGVQHAHQKAIIHRDLKPSNVLVAIRDGKAVPKIIDFGVAKATAQKLTEQTMYTQLGVLIGTPEYMSPEQAEMTGQDVDTRTDVYALGVILYELLVGALPLDSRSLRSEGFDAIRRKIREEDPPRPSTRLSTMGDGSTESARFRGVDLPTLQRQLRGDLDWITMKALEKDRTRRYGSPSELAADIARHLEHQPVLASPPSATYRARKFVRRHTAGVVTAVAGLLVLVAFATTMAVQANRIAAERDRANREAEAKGQVAEFLKDLFAVSDPGEARGNSITARELLDKGAEKIEQLEDERTRAELMATMGGVYLKLGLAEEAERLIERAVGERKRLWGADDPDTLWSTNLLANVSRSLGRYDEAERLYIETIEGFKRVYGDDHRATLTIIDNLACLYRDTGRDDDAEPLFLHALEGLKRSLGADDPMTITSVHHLAHLYQSQGRNSEAERLYLEAIEARKRVQGEDHWRTFESTGNLALMYTAQGRYDEAEALYLETFEGRKRVFGARHPVTTTILFHLARNEALRGDRAKAMDWLRQAVEAGYAKARRIASDPDLVALRGPELDAVVERARQNAEDPRANYRVDERAVFPRTSGLDEERPDL